jgi:hypothetical protein
MNKIEIHPWSCPSNQKIDSHRSLDNRYRRYECESKNQLSISAGHLLESRAKMAKPGKFRVVSRNAPVIEPNHHQRCM